MKNRIFTTYMVFAFVLLFVCSFPCGLEILAEERPFTYDSYGRRDPFVPLVGEVSGGKSLSGLEGVLTIDDVKLQGVLVGADGKNAAILNGEIVPEGSTIGIMRIQRINGNSVTIVIEEDSYELSLYE